MNDSLGRAFNPSVLFMMAMPFFVVGAIAGGLIYAYRRAQKTAANPGAGTRNASADGRNALAQQDSSLAQ